MIAQAVTDAFKLRDRRPIWEWAHDNVTLPPVLSQTSAFSVEDSLHFCEPFNALRDDRVRETNIMAPPRSGKSLIGDLFIPWTIDNDPASILHVFHDDQIAKSYAETRAMPTILSVSAVQDLTQSNRHATRTKEVVFANGLPYIVTGPALGKLQARGFRVVILDEPWIIAEKFPGRMAEAKARMEDFARQQRNKYLCNAQGGTAGDDWDLQFQTGNIHEWHVTCHDCKKPFRTEWEGKRSDGSRYGIRYENEKDENGRRRLARAIETIRFECPHCGHAHIDSARVKNYWNATGQYVANPEGSTKRKSFHWDSLIIDVWADQVEQWIAAQDAYDDGNHSPLKIFYQKRRAEPYDPEKAERIYELPTVEIRTGDDGKHWEKQDYIFLTVDVQRDHFWAMVTAWNKDGSFMILFADKLFSWDDVAAKQMEYGIADQCVFVDAGDGSRQSEIYYYCASHGHKAGAKWKSWVALRGADQDKGFPVQVGKKFGKPVMVQKPYSWPPQKGDPLVGERDPELKKSMRGKYCPVITWSNYIIKGIAKVRRDELSEGKSRSQMVAGGWNEAFGKQLHAEKLTTIVDKFGGKKQRWVQIGKRPNHLWDCLCMQLVAAGMAGILSSALPE